MQPTAHLLQTIFYPGSALHDLAVVVRGRKVLAARRRKGRKRLTVV